LIDRKITRIAVDRSRRGIDDAAYAELPSSQQHVESAADVDFIVFAGVACRDDDIPGGFVNDDVGDLDDLAHQIEVGDAAANHLEFRIRRGEIVFRAGVEVIQHRDRSAAFEKLFDRV